MEQDQNTIRQKEKPIKPYSEDYGQIDQIKEKQTFSIPRKCAYIENNSMIYQ